MKITKNRRPEGNPDGDQKLSSEGDTSLPQFRPDAALNRAHGMLLLMVFNPSNGRHRRRVFLSLSAAEKAAQRARQRGHIAHVILGSFVASEVVA